MNRLVTLTFCLSLLLGTAGCVPSPLGPSPIAAATATPVAGPGSTPTPTLIPTYIPGQGVSLPTTVLGLVPCSGSLSGPTGFIVRSAAEWSSYMAGAGCASPPGAIDLASFDFAAQSVVILQYLDCGNSIYRDLHIWDVYQRASDLYVRTDVDTAAGAPLGSGCYSVAVAIPATTQGASWTICQQDPSYHCVGLVTP